jgi:oxygen-independent coproporphyrinogen-3 oxidase
VNDKIQAEQYKYLTKKATKMGWDFYEISNLSKPGHRAIHNSNYWKNKPYLGIGPSAHSYNGNIRKWNISDNKKYTENINSGAEYYTSEILSTADKYNEYILTNIRTTEGIQLTTLENFEVKNVQEIEKELQTFCVKRLVGFRWRYCYVNPRRQALGRLDYFGINVLIFC